jgi:sugar/nucleoside kinase (ribokinase family)
MSSGVDAIVAGHVCLDIYPDLSGVGREPFEEIFLPGRLVTTGPASCSTGGAISNTGLALNHLGIATRLAGMVGDDLFGQAIMQIFTSHGADLTGGMVVSSSANTSYTIIISYPGIDRIFLHYPGANDVFQSDDVPYPLLSQARLFHFGYPPIMREIFSAGGAQLVEIFQRAKQTGITTSLDMAFPDPSSEAGRTDWRSILASVLPRVDIFMPSAEEILFMLQQETYQRMCRAAKGSDILPLITPELLSDIGKELIAMGASIVGLKLGYRGLYLRTGDPFQLNAMGRAQPSNAGAWANRELWTPCYQVAVAGTTGSGDATIAGFLSALLRGLAIEEALSMAVAVGACNVEAADALSGIRTWESTQCRIAAGWKRQPLELNAPGWQFDSDCGHWRGPCA